jgi:ATP-dependent protease ClpP protease subunit
VRLLALAFLITGCAVRVAPDQYGHYVAAAKPESVIEVVDFDEDSLDPILDEVEAAEDLLYFKLNSFGGSIYGGLDLIQAVEEAKKRGVHVKCVVDQRAMSMAMVLLQAVCDERLMTKRSILLAHNGSMKTGGTHDDLLEDADHLAALNVAMAEIVADRLGMSIEAYRAKIDRRSWILTWREALEVNAIDGVVDPMDLPPVKKLAKPFKLPF